MAPAMTSDVAWSPIAGRWLIGAPPGSAKLRAMPVRAQKHSMSNPGRSLSSPFGPYPERWRKISRGLTCFKRA